MPVAPFMPLIAQGAGMLGSSILGKKATADAQQRSPEEQAALAGQTGAAQNLGTTAANLNTSGNQLLGQGKNYTGQAGGYFQTLLNGNRAAMANATAGTRATLQDSYRGAQSNLAASGLRGAARDQAASNLQRQGTGQIAGLTTGVQPGAANALAGMGQNMSQLGGNMLGTGAQAYGTQGTIYGNMLGQGFANRKYAREEGGNTGRALGSLIAGAGPVLQTAFGGKSSTFAGPKNLGPVDPAQLPGWSATPY